MDTNLYKEKAPWRPGAGWPSINQEEVRTELYEYLCLGLLASNPYDLR